MGKKTPKSVANVPLVFSGLMIPVKVMPIRFPFEAKSLRLCSRCKTIASDKQACSKCGKLLEKPPAITGGTPATKSYYCETEGCGSLLADRVVQKPFCGNCARMIEQEELISAFFLPDSQVVTITSEETAAIEALRPRGEIRVISAIPAGKLPQAILLDAPYQVLPDRKGELGLAVLARAMLRIRMSLLVELTLQKEHRAIIGAAPDSKLWLITLLANADLISHEMPGVSGITEEQVSTMCDILESSFAPDSDIETEATAASAFRLLLESRASGAEAVIPKPRPDNEQLRALGNQLQGSLAQLEAKKDADAKAKKAKKK